MFQGKFMPDESLSSAALSNRSPHRPAAYGTLSAADAASRESPFHLNSNGVSMATSHGGVFNLPRYYPKYQTFSRPMPNDVLHPARNGHWNAGENRRQTPFYKDEPFNPDDDLEDTVDRSEPIYSKPKKSQSGRPRDRSDVDGLAAIAAQRESFTIAAVDLDSYELSQSAKARRREKQWCFCRTALIIMLIVVLAAAAIVLGIILCK